MNDKHSFIIPAVIFTVAVSIVGGFWAVRSANQLTSTGLEATSAAVDKATIGPGATMGANGTLVTTGGAILSTTSGTTNGLIVANGNVGIGTTTPANKLTIEGDVQISGDFITASTKAITSNPRSGSMSRTACVDDSIWIKVAPGSSPSSARLLWIDKGGGGFPGQTHRGCGSVETGGSYANTDQIIVIDAERAWQEQCPDGFCGWVLVDENDGEWHVFKDDIYIAPGGSVKFCVGSVCTTGPRVNASQGCCSGNSVQLPTWTWSWEPVWQSDN